MGEDLEQFRKEIDSIDSEIVSLLNKRARVAHKVGEHKKNQDMRLYVPEREKELLDRLEEINTGDFPDESLRHIYNEIISTCLNLEKSLNVAYLGPEATFTHSAALDRFGRASKFIPYEAVSQVFDAVEREEVDFGVVPIENSQEGAVRHTLDRFLESNLSISSECYLAIDLCLLTQQENTDRIEVLYSHQQAFSQARQWIDRNLPEVKIEEVSSTARAADLATQQPESGAVASSVAGEIYGLNQVAARIEDQVDNYTRFLVLGRKIAAPTGDDKTTIAFSLQDRAGALYEMLEPFGRLEINMTKIESRPSKSKTWDYIFFVDFLGHQEEENIQVLLDILKSQSPFFKILGSYPREEPFSERE